MGEGELQEEVLRKTPKNPNIYFHELVILCISPYCVNGWGTRINSKDLSDYLMAVKECQCKIEIPFFFKLQLLIFEKSFCSEVHLETLFLPDDHK